MLGVYAIRRLYIYSIGLCLLFGWCLVLGDEGVVWRGCKQRRQKWPLINVYPAHWMLYSYVMLSAPAVVLILWLVRAKKWRSRRLNFDLFTSRRIEHILVKYLLICCYRLLVVLDKICLRIRDLKEETFDILSILSRPFDLNRLQWSSVMCMKRCITLVFVVYILQHGGVFGKWYGGTLGGCADNAFLDFVGDAASREYQEQRQCLFFWNEKISVMVAKPNGTSECVLIRRNAKVKTMLSLVQEKMENEETEDIYFTFGGKVLHECDFIADHNIQNESTVFMLYRLRGGGKVSKDRREYFRNRRHMTNNAQKRAQERLRKKKGGVRKQMNVVPKKLLGRGQMSQKMLRKNDKRRVQSVTERIIREKRSQR